MRGVEMRGVRLDRVLASTAIALALSVTSSLAQSALSQSSLAQTGSGSSAAVEALVPMPEEAGLPPISASDIGGPVTGATTSPTETKAASIENAIPMPEPAGVPPPGIGDVGKIPFPGVAAADIPLAEKLNEIITGRSLDRLVPRKAERTALQSFYTARNFKPLWIENRAPNQRAGAAIARLKDAEIDGLDPDDYVIPDLKSADSHQALAEGEIRLTLAVLTFARHAQSGRVHPARISSNIEYNLPIPEPADILTSVASSPDIAKTLDGFNPPHPGFRALKAKLAEARGGKPNAPEVVRIPGGKSVKPGKRDERIPLLRERLGLDGDDEDTLYDSKLVDAVKKFQKEKGLSATGTLNSPTVDALNGRRPGNDTEVILSNMERWRWLPRDIGKAYAMVNIPDYSLKVVRDGATIFKTRIVVGKPATPTPVFSAMLENILVNPTWHVPESIIYGEYLPALQQDPEVLRRMGLIMDYNRDGSISIRQPPGERNALGRIKFNFANRFQVYLHDTPDKNLFAHDKRAYSHGCMRVQNPTQFGEVLASIALPGQGITAGRLESLFGTGEHWLRFTHKIPVHLTYMNAYVDDGGKLVVRDDIYGIDARVQAALKGDYRVSEIAPPAEPRRESQQIRRYREQYRDRYNGYARREAYQNFPFFGLFFQ